jgi:hypothetical protein
MEKYIGCSRKQRIRNITKMATNKCWMPMEVGHSMRERKIG